MPVLLPPGSSLEQKWRVMDTGRQDAGDRVGQGEVWGSEGQEFRCLVLWAFFF